TVGSAGVYQQACANDSALPRASTGCGCPRAFSCETFSGSSRRKTQGIVDSRQPPVEAWSALREAAAREAPLSAAITHQEGVMKHRQADAKRGARLRIGVVAVRA